MMVCTHCYIYADRFDTNNAENRYWQKGSSQEYIFEWAEDDSNYCQLRWITGQ